MGRKRRSWWAGELAPLLFGLAVVLAALVLSPTTEHVSILGWPIPEVCGWKRWFGVGCPGCGLTRSFAFMAKLQFSTAFAMNPMGPFMFGICAIQIPYRSWLMFRSYQEHTARNP